MSELGANRLLAFPAKVHAILERGSADPTYPISVELSLTNHCNLDCRWCGDRSLRTRHPGELTTEKVKRLLDELSVGGTRGVVIEGGGEPTINRNFIEIVRYAVQVGLRVGVVTNGLSSKPIEVGALCEWIRVSLDASSRREYLIEKRRDCFARVMRNIARLVQRCPVVGVGFVVTSDNFAEIVTLAMRLKVLGVSYLQCRVVVDHPHLIQGLHFPREELEALEDENFSVPVEGMTNNLIAGNAGVPCRSHSLTSTITANGAVYLCGRLNVDSSWPPIGNLLGQSFQEIWLGAERKRQAALITDPSFCRVHCPPCRMTKFNRLLDDVCKIPTPNFI